MRFIALFCAFGAVMLSAADDTVSLIQASARGSDHVVPQPELREAYYPMTWHTNSMKNLLYNNLGGLGPKKKKKHPHEMRFGNVSFLHTPAGNVELDLKITCIDAKYWAHDKISENGLHYEFGTFYTKKERAQRFLVELVYTGTNINADVEQFSFSVFDIDDAPGSKCTTTIAVWGADGYYILPDAYHDMSVTGEQHWHNHTSAIVSCSRVLDHLAYSNIKNPTYVKTVSGEQARAAIVYHFHNTSQFEMGVYSKKLRSIFFVGAENPLQWGGGLKWHEVFEPIVHPVLIPGHGQLFRWVLDQEATVKYNNLGGRGPNYADPPQIRYSGVGQLITHSNHSNVTNGSNTSVIINTSSIDLVVIVEEQYFGSQYINENWNGANGEFGEIGLSGKSEIIIIFTFVYHDTDIPAVSPSHDFVIFDIDNQIDTSLGEEYIVYGAHEMWLTNDSHVVLNESDPTQMHLKSNVKINNGAVENPTSWGNLTDDQANVAAYFRYYDTATWRVKFITTAEINRAFLFSGQSRPPLPEIAEKKQLPTPAPTPSPTRPRGRGTPAPTPLEFFVNDPTPTPTAGPATPTTYGDPHVKNLQGEAFDINRAASHTFLLIPRGAEKGRAQLHMRGVVTPRGDTCSGMLYLTQLIISGEWLGAVGSLDLLTAGEAFDVPEAVGLKVGGSGNLSVEEFRSRLPPKMANVTLLHPEEPKVLNKHVTTLLVRLYLGPTILRLSWEHQKEKEGYSNSLMLVTYGLSNVTGEVGGLLGADDHEWAATQPESCENSGPDSEQHKKRKGLRPSCCVRAMVMLGEP